MKRLKARMEEAWSKLVGVLCASAEHSSGRCIGFNGNIKDAQLQQLCSVLKTSSFQGGLRLKGKHFEVQCLGITSLHLCKLTQTCNNLLQGRVANSENNFGLYQPESVVVRG